MTKEITAEQEKQIEEKFKTLGPAAPVGPKGTRDDFCSKWPELRAVLEFIRDLPGVPGPVKSAIGTVISAGDTLQSIIC